MQTITAKEFQEMAKGRSHRAMLAVFDGEAVRYGCLALDMPPLSLNNLFVSKGRRRFAADAYKDWQSRALLQLRRQDSWHVPGPTRIRLRFNREQTGADLDNLAKPVLDILVKAGRIADDRNVRELRLLFTDKANGTMIDIWSTQLAMDSDPPRDLSFPKAVT